MYLQGNYVLLYPYDDVKNIECKTYLNCEMEKYFGKWYKVYTCFEGSSKTTYTLSDISNDTGITKDEIFDWVFDEKWISFGTGDTVVAKDEEINGRYEKAKDTELVVIEPVNDAQMKCQIASGQYAGEFCIVATADFIRKDKKIKEEEQDMDNIESFTQHQKDMYEISKEEISYLTKECIEKYDYCQIYDVSYDAVEKAVKESLKNKAWLWNAFSKHPNYIGHGRIAFDADYERTVNKRVVDDFAIYLYDVMRREIPKEIKVSNFSYQEVVNYFEALKDKKSLMERYHNVIIDGRTHDEILEDLRRFRDILMRYKDTPSKEMYRNGEYIRVSQEDIDKTNALTELIGKQIFGNYDACITKEQADIINTFNPDIRANGGQKKSRLINKIAKLYGINFDENEITRRKYADFADAINPFVIKRHTVLSINPADYLTMSWGTNWTSCHTIDKENIHGYEGHAAGYRGCYSSGTHSYMLDGSSFIYYTVNGKREVEDYGKELKESRQMFHIGEDKLIQGRLYPYDQTDCDCYAEPEEYTQIRVIVQRIISELFDIPNYWTNRKGTSACGESCYNHGTHYRDMTHYDNCNVSILRNSKNETNIHIGHNPICPCCGREHDYEDTVTCGSCTNNEHECYECGSYGDEDNMHEIDGEWYCEECCFWCNYHEEWETGDAYYVEDYGDVCEYAIDHGDFFHCDNCDCYFYDSGDTIETHDGSIFCCEDCAERADYVYSDAEDDWYYCEEVTYCDNCGQYVLNENYDSEREMCNECVEENEEEREAV